jgi:hypothetical protein
MSLNQRVQGSSPCAPTIEPNDFKVLEEVRGRRSAVQRPVDMPLIWRRKRGTSGRTHTYGQTMDRAAGPVLQRPTLRPPRRSRINPGGR